MTPCCWRKLRRLQCHCEPTPRAERLQRENGVGHRNVLEKVLPAAEVAEQLADRHLVGTGVAGRERDERVGDELWEVVPLTERDGELPGFRILAANEVGKSRRVPPDRALRLRRAGLQSPARVLEGALSVTGDEPRLHRPDRPTPTASGRVRPALAVALRCSQEPCTSLFVAAGHEQRQSRCPCRISHACELPLPLVRVLGQTRGPVVVALDRSRRAFRPGVHEPRSIVRRMARTLHEVVYVDGVRTAFGRAGKDGFFWKTRADDMAVKVVRELLRRNPDLPEERIDDVVFAATAQVGDQGLTLGRDVALLAGLPKSVPGFAVDRMCAGALTATTSGAGEIAMGAADVVLVGGVEHMGHHPMGEDVDFNPRFISERIVDESAAVMGQTAENLHDAFPHLTRKDADAFAVESQRRAAKAWDEGVMDEIVVPMSVFTDEGWAVAARDEFLRPDTTMEALAELRTPFRTAGRVTAGNSAGLTDGATAALITSEKSADEFGLEPKMRLVGFAYAGVEPELMGLGPVPATNKVLEQTGISLDDVGLFELNEPFAVQVLTWCDGVDVEPDDPRLNPYGGAIACGHPLAATGVRLMAQLARGFRDRPDVRYGLTALCIGLGMGAAVLWENVQNGSSG